jgi:acetyl esterase/lipase
VVVHGGSWDNGRKGTPGTVFLAAGLAQYGYVTFDINYRLNGHGGQYPNSIQDVEAAVAYLSSQARPLRIDPSKIGVVGISAGAYLALMAAYRAGVPPFAPPSSGRGHAPASVHIAAAGAFFAPVELKDTIQTAIGLRRLQKLTSYMGTTYEQNRLRYKMASPLRYSDSAVPTILWYGTADPMTPLDPTYELYKRLRQRQIRAELLDLPGAPHNLTQLSPAVRKTVFTQLLDFLNSVFYQGPPVG